MAQLAFKRSNNGSKLGGDVITEFILRVFNRWRKIFTSFVYNTKSQETQNKIFLQQLKTQSMNFGKYVRLSNLDPFFLLRGHFETGSKVSPV